MVIDVLTQIKSTGVDKTFSYSVPTNLEPLVKIGSRVTIPFGRQILEGFVISFHDSSPVSYQLKDIIDVIDKEPVLNEELLEIGNYISKKWVCTRATAYQTMLPKALKAKQGVVVRPRYETYLILKDKNYQATSDKQQKVLDLLNKDEEILKGTATVISTSSVKTLIEKKVIEEIKKEVYRTVEITEKKDCKHKLNEEQQTVVETVLKYQNEFQPFLLHGVTGSGKTEVYMHLIEEVLKEQKEALVLVPEISLTPQFVSLFKSRFGSTIAILHSGLSNGEKYDEWRKIVRKEVSIVIGARSAVFAPLTNLGMVIIDEEHSTSYKQDNTPYYHAIDIATKRAKRYKCPIILGSATPSIESYTRAKLGIYKLLEMKERVNKNLPKVFLVDMKEELRKGRKLFSKILEDSIYDRLSKKEQVMILLNRRGYSTVLSCKSCGYTEKCPRCDIPLIYHKKEHLLKCHYCGFTKPLTNECPECHSHELSYFGLGTQKLEEEIQKQFQARTLRMDIDTTSKKGSHKKMIEAFENHEYDILIGTQMIAKGLDFSNVTLVGVINADSSLNVPDFRSAERTYELLSQIAGRSGRGEKKGTVILQGFNMDHYSIVKASQHDYLGFYNQEIKIRKTLSYPPFYNLCLVQVQGKEIEIVEQEISKIASYLRRELKEVNILGPSPAMMPKMNNIYYVQIIIKYKKLKDIYPSLQFLYDQYKMNRKVRMVIDINPNKL